MKKIILIIMITLYIYPTFADEYNYPVYYGTKKCELINNSENNSKIYAYYYDKEKAEYYIFNGYLYKNDKLYKKGVDYLLFEVNGNVIYGVKNNSKIDIYINNKLNVSVDEIEKKSIYYDKSIDKYQFDTYNDSRHYIFTNGELIDYENYYYQTRFFSENKKVFIDLFNNANGFRLEKDGKTIVEEKGNYSINDIVVSNNNNYSLVGYDNTNKKRIFIKNGTYSEFENVEKILYSPNGKDLYFVTKNDNIYTFYKNEEKLGEFYSKGYPSLDFNFIDDNNFFLILSDGKDYALIKNGKILIPYDSDIQLKLYLKKENGDLFIVKRYKKSGKDVLFINGKKILEAEVIDERFLNYGKGTFSIYPNRLKSNQYYTYVTINGNDYLYVNGFSIPNIYDYLKLEDGLNNFNFLSYNDGLVACKDITYTYKNLGYDREVLEQLILKIRYLDNSKKSTLINKLKKYLEKPNLSEINRELIKMFIDNLSFNLK